MRTPAYLLATVTLMVAASLSSPIQPSPQQQRTLQHTSYLAPRQLHATSVYSNCIELDISELEKLRTDMFNFIYFNSTDNKENISYGLLEEDWARLKHLEERLPTNSPLKPKLLKLFRLLILALYEAHKSSPEVRKVFPNISKSNGLDKNNSVVGKNKLNSKLEDKQTTKSISLEETDNEASESEQRPSVLQCNTTPTAASTIETPGYDQNINEGYKQTSHTDRKVFSKNNDAASVTQPLGNKQLLKISNTLHPRNQPDETTINIIYRETSYNATQRRVTPVYGADVTEDYQDLKFHYGKEHDLSAEAEKEASTMKNSVGHKDVKFIEEYEDKDTTTPVIAVVTGIDESSNVEIENETTEDVNKIKYGLTTPSSQRLKDNITSIRPSPGTDEQSNHQDIVRPTTSYSKTESVKKSTPASNAVPTPPYHPKVTKNITSNFTPYTIVSTSDADSRQDKSLHSSSLSNTTLLSQNVTASENKTANDTFRIFTLVFPEYPKLTSPTMDVNKLKIYPLDRGRRIFYPFNIQKNSSFVREGCNGKKGCTKVRNIEFYHPKRSDQYYNEPKSGIISEDVRPFSTEGESNRKRWDSDNALWWNKMRILRKKT